MIYYKYLPFNHNAMNCLYEDGLYFCSLNGFDDAFEGEAIPNPQSMPGRPSIEQQKKNVENAKKKLRSIGVLSLTKKWDMKKMWAAYGGSFYGMCLGYEIEESMPYFSEFEKIVKVDYSTTNNIPSVTDVISLDTASSELYEFASRTKALEWAEQDEYRLISRKGAGVKQIGRIKEVCFGCKMDDDTKKFLYQYLSRKDSSISFYNTKRKTGTLDLDREPYSVPKTNNEKLIDIIKRECMVSIRAWWMAVCVHKLFGTKIIKRLFQ